jgi:hypothetical protein
MHRVDLTKGGVVAIGAKLTMPTARLPRNAMRVDRPGSGWLQRAAHRASSTLASASVGRRSA